MTYVLLCCILISSIWLFFIKVILNKHYLACLHQKTSLFLGVLCFWLISFCMHRHPSSNQFKRQLYFSLLFSQVFSLLFFNTQQHILHNIQRYRYLYLYLEIYTNKTENLWLTADGKSHRMIQTRLKLFSMGSLLIARDVSTHFYDNFLNINSVIYWPVFINCSQISTGLTSINNFISICEGDILPVTSFTTI